MLIGEIIGTVVSTVKVSTIENARLKIVKITDPFGKATGRYFIVEDGVGVGIGEKVLIADDPGIVKKLLGKEDIPIRSAIVAKIDKINIYE